MVVAGVPSAGCAGVPCCPVAERLLDQRPQLRRGDLSRDDQRGVVRDEVLRPERLQSSRDIALFDASVPISGKPYGCDAPKSAAAIAVAGDLAGILALLHQVGEPARALPLDFLRREARMPDDVGHQHRAARRSSAAATRPSPATRPSSTTCAAIAPSCATSSAICSALRVAVPSSSIAAVKFASPGLSAGFAPLPVLTTRLAETIGRPRPLVDEHRQAVRRAGTTSASAPAASWPRPPSAAPSATPRRR